MRLTRVIVSAILLSASAFGVAEESDYNLGVSAYQSKNYPQAAARWKESVARGNVDAMNNLGFLLYNGYGIAKDIDAAIELWRTASYAGQSEAQWHLGIAYHTGVGVPQDAARAYAWIRCSMESASHRVRSKQEDAAVEADILKDATDSLSQLLGKLSASELARGQALANEYIARYGKPAP
jgi:hypothetical protein